MKAVAIVICVILFPSIGTVAYAAPTVEVWNGPKMILGLPACDGRTDDSNTLIIRNGSEEIGHYHFCATFVVKTAKLITDNIGNSYVFLQYATGHGTADVLVFHLTVFEVPHRKVGSGILFEYFTTVTSTNAGAGPPMVYWIYPFKVEKLTCGGLTIVFTREVHGTGKVLSAPAEKVRVIDVGVPLNCKCSR